MRHRASSVLGFIFLTVTASILFGYAVMPVKAAPVGIIWAKSEQIGTHDQQAIGATVDASGVYVVGYDQNLASLYNEWRVEKRDLATGTPLWSFSEHISATFGNDAATAVAVDGTGVYIVGYDSAVGRIEWRIEKRDPSTGSFINTFGIGGAISEHISNHDDAAYGVTIDGTSLYAVGYDQNTAGNLAEWRIEKRDLSTGALTWSVSEHISTAYDVASGVAVDSTGVYVVGYDQIPGLNIPEWRIEKRDLTNGALIATFGVGGAISEHISTADDQASGIALDSTGLYVVGWDQNTSGNWDEWRIEKRDLSTGSFISAFGTSGIITEHISRYRDDAYAVTIDSTGLCVVGKDENSPSYPEWRIEKRNLTTGGTIWSVSEDISTNYPGNQAYGVAIDKTGVYVVGSDSAIGSGFAEWRIEKRFNIAAQIALVLGWNLISLPIVPVNAAIGTVLASQIASGSFSIVWSYQGGAWKSATLNPITHTLSGPLTTMQDGLGYWIFMTGADTLFVAGSILPLPPATPPSYPLSAGWNLIGFKPQPDPTANETVSVYLTNIMGSYDSNNVWVYDNTSQSWVRANPSYALQPGQAMWILTTTPSVLRP